MSKISIRFFKDHEVRAVWDDANAKWWVAAVDTVAILSGSADARNYWYVLKSRLKKANSETLTNCKGFKLTAPDAQELTQKVRRLEQNRKKRLSRSHAPERQ